YVDGGCRGNGRPGAIGAAAAVHMKKWGGHVYRTRKLSRDPFPTNQRAEILAIILGLEMALDKYDELDSDPDIDLRIFSDSKYAIGCMNEWIHKWVKNDWTTAAGYEVANRDLIEEASDLDDKVMEIGTVRYTWISIDENELADEYCNDAFDEQ
ncbi:ribonuclease H-like protein, partial [Rhizodiscina lignyota]